MIGLLGTFLAAPKIFFLKQNSGTLMVYRQPPQRFNRSFAKGNMHLALHCLGMILLSNLNLKKLRPFLAMEEKPRKHAVPILMADFFQLSKVQEDKRHHIVHHGNK